MRKFRETEMFFCSPYIRFNLTQSLVWKPFEHFFFFSVEYVLQVIEQLKVILNFFFLYVNFCLVELVCYKNCAYFLRTKICVCRLAIISYYCCFIYIRKLKLELALTSCDRISIKIETNYQLKTRYLQIRAIKQI